MRPASLPLPWNLDDGWILCNYCWLLIALTVIFQPDLSYLLLFSWVRGPHDSYFYQCYPNSERAIAFSTTNYHHVWEAQYLPRTQPTKMSEKRKPQTTNNAIMLEGLHSPKQPTSHQNYANQVLSHLSVQTIISKIACTVSISCMASLHPTQDAWRSCRVSKMDIQ